jgi:hypothetical protein
VWRHGRESVGVLAQRRDHGGCGAALALPEQPLIASQVDEPGVPESMREHCPDSADLQSLEDARASYCTDTSTDGEITSAQSRSRSRFGGLRREVRWGRCRGWQ